MKDGAKSKWNKNNASGDPRPDAKFKLPPNYRHPSFSAPSAPLFSFAQPGKRMRSAVVAVGIIGVIGYMAWPETDVQRNSYNTKEDCEHDYATGQCTYEQPTTSGYSGGYYHYYGPWYRSDWGTRTTQGDPGPGRTLASRGPSGAGHGPSGFDFGSRGGFGSSGRVSARGG